jgi:hypothetical protein
MFYIAKHICRLFNVTQINKYGHCSPKYKMIISLDYIDAKNKIDATREIDTVVANGINK